MTTSVRSSPAVVDAADGRPLINRNPAQTNRTYAHGHLDQARAMEVDPY